MRRAIPFASIAFVAVMAIPVAGTRSTFVPDWTFKGSALTGWQVLGQADWRAENGELVGKPKDPSGGWLLLDKPFQDIQFGADFKCTGGCKTGILLRAQKTADGMKGVYVALVDGEPGSYAVTLDASGKELTRQKLGSAGGMARFAPTAPAAGAGAGGARGG